MKTELVRIVNSRGIRIPKPLIEQCGLGETVDLRIENHCLVISPQHKVRHGWGDTFRATAHVKDDELLLEKMEPNRFDHEEWRW